MIPDGLTGEATLVAREAGVVAGIAVAAAVFSRLDGRLRTFESLSDGDRLEDGSVLATVEGPVAPMLTAERTALNFVQRMSGIATLTARYVDAVKGTDAVIVDTRKTAPGLRVLDKFAVAAGGGRNHRQGLGDGVLIKDNHIAALRAQGIDLVAVVERARANAPHTVRIEVEVQTMVEAEEALRGGADILLLDNMSVEAMREAVGVVAGRALLEASGGITLDNVADVAATGVDLISVGALTHSGRALDISMEFGE